MTHDYLLSTHRPPPHPSPTHPSLGAGTATGKIPPLKNFLCKSKPSTSLFSPHPRLFSFWRTTYPLLLNYPRLRYFYPICLRLRHVGGNVSMFRGFVYRFGLVGVAGRYLLLWRRGIGWSRSGFLSLSLLLCLPALWLGLPLLVLRVVCRSSGCGV